MMSTWLSYRDLTNLIEKSLFTPEVGHTVVYGMSANKDVWWDNSAAAHLGFAPQDSSEVFRAKVEAQEESVMIARRAPLALLVLLALPAVAVAQGPPLTLPQPSQAATATQRIGLTDITPMLVRNNV